MDPLGVLDAAAVGPVAADHVAAIDRAGEAARHAVAGNGDVGPAAKTFCDAVVLDVDGHGRAFHVVADDAPAGRGVGVGEPLDHGHGVEGEKLGAADRLRQQHGVDAGLAQCGHHIVSQIARCFGFHSPGSTSGSSASRCATWNSAMSGVAEGSTASCTVGPWSGVARPRPSVGPLVLRARLPDVKIWVGRDRRGQDFAHTRQRQLARATIGSRWCRDVPAERRTSRDPDNWDARDEAAKPAIPHHGGIGHCALPQSWAGRAARCRFFSLDQRSGKAEILSL